MIDFEQNVTGTGTEANPWMVHSYEQLKTYLGKNKNDEADPDVTYSDIYVTLANDIDCNNYGSGWEWTSIAVPYNSARNVVFDLGGNTIKNVMVARNNSFIYYNTNTNVPRILIRNGYILNLFTNESKDICRYVTFNNISMSAYLNTTDTPFARTDARESSFYLMANRLNTTHIFSYSSTDNDYVCLKNCDVYFDIYDVNHNYPSDTSANHALIYNGASNATSIASCDGCRLRGKLRKNTSCRTLLTYNKVVNTVIDIEIPEFAIEGTNKNLMGYEDNCTGIVNTSIINGGDESTYTIGKLMTKCNSEQLRDVEWLNRNGFFVIEINEDLRSR